MYCSHDIDITYSGENHIGEIEKVFFLNHVVKNLKKVSVRAAR